ncbi:arginine--tRNA ligase [Priestia taiwanensis]|uniref:Arginine--tRNA ligase n=1 Tax=Priestia taiwanensis TaxID=1347902 RepID=A0A917ATI0_9BACI|nr:arginine--tRNA ligase [Priestia taiwanensis]MBM7364274.1 arginyl-tRNA synthetase [Priestia taiwanensis]GGE73146.1 arginine--tRNA ligase [Priestia taiwanensis]
MNEKLIVASCLSHALDGALHEERILALLEQPKHAIHGDLAFPCFELAKTLRKSPAGIASELANTLQHKLVSHVEAVGPYVNFFLHRHIVSNTVLTHILDERNRYGNLAIGDGQHVPIDLSSPNIAKPFSMGHLRSTVIGNAIANIMAKCDYKPIKINYIGDWGTQFGKLIVAYKKWGSPEQIKQTPIKELLKLYVHFHKEAEKYPALEDEGRAWFKKLEDGNEEAHHLWGWFRSESLIEFNKIYDLLGISFDSTNGEAFYNDKMDEIVTLLEEAHLLIEDNGAQVVMLEEPLPPCLIKKSDGATLYATRDIAAALYRKRTYNFAQAIYVVGGEQRLHFQQLFAVLQKLGFDWAKNMIHVPFGMILKDGKKMSTRKGKVVLLEEVLTEAIHMATQNITEKNPALTKKEVVARQVGVGAVIFHDLKNDRMNNIEFSLEDMLKFEGETGPYVQYSYARACSILRKASHTPGQATIQLEDDLSWTIVKLLHHFPTIIQQAHDKLEPSIIAKYVVDLSQAFNTYYGNVHIMIEDEQLQSRLVLVEAVAIVLKEGLRLLGIAAPEEM